MHDWQKFEALHSNPLPQSSRVQKQCQKRYHKATHTILTATDSYHLLAVICAWRRQCQKMYHKAQIVVIDAVITSTYEAVADMLLRKQLFSACKILIV